MKASDNKVTTTMLDAVQLPVDVPTTVQTVVAVGVTFIEVPNKLPGIHAQVFAPAPVNTEVVPLQTESGEAVAVTVGIGLMVDVSVVVLAHCPALGVKVQVPMVVLLIVEGLQVPVIPFGDVFDNIGATSPLQKAGMVAKLGTVGANTVTVRIWFVGHKPEFGVNV